MQTYKLASGGEVYHFDTGPFNWYVIQQDGRLTLVDAGFSGHYKIFKAGIKALGYDLSDVAAILLTHAHADHMGFAERLRQKTNVPIFVHRADQTAAQRILQLPWFGLLSNAWRPYTTRILLHAIRNGVFTLPRITKTYTFEDGDRLDVPGKPRVLHIPGHTPGEVALYLEDDQILFSGDTLVMRNLLTGSLGQPQIVPPILTNDYATACHAVERFRELGAVTMLSGHGQPWQGDLNEAVNLALGTTQ